MNKATLKRLLRKLGLIKLSDTLRYRFLKFTSRKANKKFKKDFPSVAIPPDYILYEAHHIEYRRYIKNGLNNAKSIKSLFEAYTDLENKNILDWGCGPARIIRHFPELLPKSNFFGTDYNQKTITWNQTHIKNVEFTTNRINPPTSYNNDFFDVIYGLSVFTHLSAKNHELWIEELFRISKKGALLLMTTHGEIFKQKLLPSDVVKFENNEIVEQGNTLEGHRTYAAYHPPKRIKSLFESKFKILEHIPGKKESWGLSQDKWVLQKV